MDATAEKHRVFAMAYADNGGDAEAAARLAGYTNAFAARRAKTLLGLKEVQEYLALYRRAAPTAGLAGEVTAERVLRELADIAFADLAADDAPPIKMADKLRALELIYKHLGMSDHPNELEPVVLVDETG